MVTVHELRKQGNKVSIRHVREFCGIHKIEDFDNFMTRGEYEEARLNGELAYDGILTPVYYEEKYGVSRGKMPSYGKAVFGDGGWTEVVVTTPDGRELRGKHSFNGKAFNKKVGLHSALGKAVIGTERRNKKTSGSPTNAQ